MELTKNILEKMGFEFKKGICPTLTHNGVQIETYGSVICSIEIDGNNIEELFPIAEANCYDDELQFRLTEEAKKFVIDRLMEGR